MKSSEDVELMSAPTTSIFREYYADVPFRDRFAEHPDGAIDVIIPVYHTNELWKSNLLSIYREVPVSRLLISDGGADDESLSVIREFPRVEVLDHRHFKTLGKCVAELIKEVRSEWFAYLHSDVYLPPGWFDVMRQHQSSYDWFGCPMQITFMLTYPFVHKGRPYAGSQMGKRAAFFPALERVDDDYVYRQEDFVFEDVVTRNGFKPGKVENTFHYHQVMFRPSRGYDLQIERVDVVPRISPSEERRSITMQLYGIVKYLQPDSSWVIDNFRISALTALDRQYMTVGEIRSFIEEHNPKWLEIFTPRFLLGRRLRSAARWLRDRSPGWMQG